MKKYAISSLLFLMPFVAMAADDHCTKPDEYTIDKRCYVTDEQKSQKPYNSVVQVIIPDKNGICTGTIVKEKDGKPYLYTAKHCILQTIRTTFDTIIIKLEKDDAKYELTEHVDGKYWGRPETYGDDWSVYKLPEDKNEDFLKIAIEKTIKSPGVKYSARVVGYGALKVMSDKEIHDFKQEYDNYLESIGKSEEISDGGVYTGGKYDAEFLNQKRSDLVKDYENLKVSVCKYSQNGGGDGCQGWHGNSGGPVLDDAGKIMAIAGRGDDMIGGIRHAGLINDQKATKELKALKATVKIKDVNRLPE